MILRQRESRSLPALNKNPDHSNVIGVLLFPQLTLFSVAASLLAFLGGLTGTRRVSSPLNLVDAFRVERSHPSVLQRFNSCMKSRSASSTRLSSSPGVAT